MDQRALAQAAEAPIAYQLADLLGSGMTGPPLVAELRTRFPHANRSEVFFGIAIAVSLFEADRLLLIHELQVAEAKAAQVPKPRARR